MKTSDCFSKSEGLNSSSIASEGAAIVSERKISNAPRKGTNMKGSGAFSHGQRPILSQSLSFPAKGGVCAGNMRKSTEEHPLRAAAKHARDEGTKVKVTSCRVLQRASLAVKRLRL
ncbi:hypothetical protein OIU77_017754 [Salix suchowensis]|uniref:Uncharacterized protein n=1 Tax=Salix suchowensis TaxID=1278906 RepID=A0ABQ8ZQF2_9ROSI|nr:hypothetical protein OIU77_017754 [Salix suchowensis]